MVFLIAVDSLKTDFPEKISNIFQFSSEGGGYQIPNFFQIQKRSHYQENYGLFPSSANCQLQLAEFSLILSFSPSSLA